MYASLSAQALSRPPPIVSVDESIFKLTNVIDDPTERIVVVMPRKPAGIGALAYLHAVKLIYSELPFCLVGFVRHAGRNAVTPLEFLTLLVHKSRSVFHHHPWYTPNVIDDSAFCAARHELSNVLMPNNARMMYVTASVRNDTDPVVKVLRAGLLEDEYRTFSLHNANTNAACFHHIH